MTVLEAGLPTRHTYIHTYYQPAARPQPSPCAETLTQPSRLFRLCQSYLLLLHPRSTHHYRFDVGNDYAPDAVPSGSKDTTGTKVQVPITKQDERVVACGRLLANPSRCVADEAQLLLSSHQISVARKTILQA